MATIPGPSLGCPPTPRRGVVAHVQRRRPAAPRRTARCCGTHQPSLFRLILSPPIGYHTIVIPTRHSRHHKSLVQLINLMYPSELPQPQTRGCRITIGRLGIVNLLFQHPDAPTLGRSAESARLDGIGLASKASPPLDTPVPRVEHNLRPDPRPRSYPSPPPGLATVANGISTRANGDAKMGDDESPFQHR